MVIKIEFTPLSLSRPQNFLKPFLKGKILRSGEWDRGVNSILTTILRF